MSDGAHFRGTAPGQHSSEETWQRWQAAGDIVANLTGSGIEPKILALIPMSLITMPPGRSGISILRHFSACAGLNGDKNFPDTTTFLSNYLKSFLTNHPAALGITDTRLDSKSGQANDVKIGIYSFPARCSALMGQCGEQAGKFTC